MYVCAKSQFYFLVIAKQSHAVGDFYGTRIEIWAKKHFQLCLAPLETPHRGTLSGKNM